MTKEADRTDLHFNELTPAEHERLALLLEEMGEAQQAIGKILRHGYSSEHPDGGPNNREILEKEMGDVLSALDMMLKAQDLDSRIVNQHKRKKCKTVIEYLHHQKPEEIGEFFRADEHDA